MWTCRLLFFDPTLVVSLLFISKQRDRTVRLRLLIDHYGSFGLSTE